MHRKGIAYRDLKLENIVLGADGYVKIIDFGFAKQLAEGELTRTLCGTPDYLAPECVTRFGHNQSVDCWGLGVIVYEMLTQCSPFADSSGSNNQMKIFQNIMEGARHVEWREMERAFGRELKPYCSPAGEVDPEVLYKFDREYQITRDMLHRLWELSPLARITCDALKQHDYFREMPWAALREKQLRPPWIPNLRGPTDMQFFDSKSFNSTKGRMMDTPFQGDPAAFQDFGSEGYP